MDTRFAALINNLHPLFERLLATPPVTEGGLPPDMPQGGVYLFSEGPRHLYAGRSNRMRKRYGEHSRPGSQHNQAVFAFRLAREGTGLSIPAYRPGEGSRTGLIGQAGFSEAFTLAKVRVRRMDYRWVEERDQTRQALLELYCAIALGCPYNDFNTH